MPQSLEACPSPCEVLEWAAGHHQGTPRGLEIGLHVRDCDEGCQDYCHTSHVVMSELCADVPEKPKEHPSSFAEVLHRQKQREREAIRLLEGPPAEWGLALRAHPDHEDPELLYCLGKQLIATARLQPTETLAYLDDIAPLLLADPKAAPRRAQAVAQMMVARGVAHRTEGDHVSALACYAKAELLLPEAALDLDHPLLLVARISSLRALKRFDEAMSCVEVARRSFECTGTIGLSKLMWQAANIAWETGDSPKACRYSLCAYRLLKAEGYPKEAPRALWTAVAALLSMHRPASARRVLARLESHPEILGEPQDRARLDWNKADLAIEEGDLDGAATLLGSARDTLAEVGSLLSAARASLDLAHVAGEMGDVGLQAKAASEAASLLRHTPGQEAEWGLAVEQLSAAVQSGSQALASFVAVLRGRLKPQR